MTRKKRIIRASLASAALASVMTGCSDRGDLTVVNDGPDDVTVMTGDQDLMVDAGGGAVLLDYGCTPGDVQVRFASGPEVVVPGLVCPDQRIVVGTGTADLRPASERP